MRIIIRILLWIKCKVGLHDPRVYAYTEDKAKGRNKEKTEMYYQCLYCPYNFWDYMFEPPDEKLGELKPYEFEKVNLKR